jgi:acetyl-CoA acyltransferase
VSDAWVIGAAMTPFGRHRGRSAVSLGAQASLDALADSGLSITEVGVFAAGSQFSTISFGQSVQKQIGQTGIPVYNVNNACATGASALRLGLTSIAAGETDVALVLGAESMSSIRGMVGAQGPALEGLVGSQFMPAVFAQVGMDYAHRHGVTREQFAKVAVKNRGHAVLNPLAQYRTPMSLAEVLNAEPIADPNTLPMCCPTGDGAAALVVVSEQRLRRMSGAVQSRAIKVAACVLATDPYTPEGEALADINTVTRNAADLAYERAGVGPGDLDLVELHDCFATAELVHYDNLRLCEPGGAGEHIDSGAPSRDGSLPVNVSGGLLSKGHPIGATGVANVYEVVTHLRGEAGDRQIEGARVGLTHVIGLGTTCVVTILQR